MALAVPLSRFTSRVGGGSAFFVRHHRNQTPNKEPVMKTKYIAALTAALVAVAAITVIAAEQHDDSTKASVYRLKSNGQVVAEVRVLASVHVHMSSIKATTGNGHTVWSSTDANKPVTFSFAVENGKPVVLSAEEIETDGEVNFDPNHTIPAK